MPRVGQAAWRLLDRHRGRSATGTTKEIRARILVNAAGPWAGDVLGRRVQSTAVSHTRLVQGSHIVVPKLFDHPACYIFQNADQRIVFAIPYQGDYTLIGTTDQDYRGDPAEVAITPAEVDYLCAAASEYFAKPVERDSVVWTYSGVRSLFEDGASAAQAATRDYVLDVDAREEQPPLLSIFGGKITTYRRLAEHVMEKLAPYLTGRTTRQPGWTGGEPLPGGEFATWAQSTRCATEKTSRPSCSPCTSKRCSDRAWPAPAASPIPTSGSPAGHPITDWAFGLVRRDRSPQARVLPGGPASSAGEPAARAAALSEGLGGRLHLQRRSRPSTAACARSSTLDYPDYEVILVDDGSTDDVPEIADALPVGALLRPAEPRPDRGPQRGRWPWPPARSSPTPTTTASPTPTGCTTWSRSCWRPGAAGVGGPNLLPAGDGPVAACVAASPGDARARPGSTTTWPSTSPAATWPSGPRALLAIGGLRPASTARPATTWTSAGGCRAGRRDRLRARGHGLAPPPRHRARPTSSSSAATARPRRLLKRKHPEKFQGFRADLSWMGRIYTRAGLGLEVGEPIVHHGIFGTGMFQTIYSAPQVWWPLMMLSPEWWFLALAMLGLAPVFNPAGVAGQPGTRWARSRTRPSRTRCSCSRWPCSR